MQLPIDSIKVKDGRRPVDTAKVRELAESMKQVGLMNSVTVNTDLELVAGAHRLAAAQLLGWEEIECRMMDADALTYELAEIDENLMRNELHHADASLCMARRKVIYEKLHPETVKGVSQAIGMNKALGHNVSADFAPTFAEDASNKTGKSKRTIYEELQVAAAIEEVPEMYEAIKAADMTKTETMKFSKLEPETRRKVAEKVSEGAASFSEAQKLIKKEERTEELQDPGRLPEGFYQVIYCDPPWQYENTGFNSSAAQHYPTMSIEELKALNVGDIASDDCVMFMWATNPLLKEAIDLMGAWGFTYKTNIAWVKDRQINIGFYVYGKHELLLIGTKGSMLPIGNKPSSVMSGSNSVHSKKPESTYETIESMYPGVKYVELFSRNTDRPNWTKWGNEVGKYD